MSRLDYHVVRMAVIGTTKRILYVQGQAIRHRGGGDEGIGEAAATDGKRQEAPVATAQRRRSAGGTAH